MSCLVLSSPVQSSIPFALFPAQATSIIPAIASPPTLVVSSSINTAANIGTIKDLLLKGKWLRMVSLLLC